MREVVGQQRCSACSRLTAYVMDEEEWHRKRCGIVQRENLMRIHIIGGPGSGKTTLAREIGAHLGIEVYELDHVAFTGPDYAKRPLPERVADITLIAGCPSWVTEGLFVLWTDELLEHANIIVWLDHIGWRRSAWRILRRFIESALQEAQNRRGLEKFVRFRDYAGHLKQLVQVFSSSRAYYSADLSPSNGRIESRRSTAAHLASYRDKVVHCYNSEAVDAFLEYVQLCHG